ncbi:MAG TPA: hypothetical protein VLO11_11165 [Luteolibacter sp.]|nr:hypothetical protein [Luteolibacter sp.]
MRVPIPVVVVLCLIVIGGGWWWWTRDRDFLAPPSEETLSRIRAGISSRTANGDGVREIDPAPAPDPRPAPAPPRLGEYLELARDSPGKLTELAADLEAQGDFQRALLAHERMIDSTTVTGDALASPLQAVRRLRAKVPQWNARPEGALVITLHAGTGEDNAARIEPVIGRLAAEMSRASSGILSVRPNIHLGPAGGHGDLPPPVAIWLGGEADSSPATLVRSITLDGDDDPETEIALTILEILADQLSKQSSLRIPPPTAADDFGFSFADRVTRLSWETVGSTLDSPDS